MMPSRLGLPLAQENPLWISWRDSNWIPILNPQTVMDYFAEKSNPFYERTCNNEIVKMQRQSLEQLNHMVGLEYILLHVQDPILYVIRKQHRHSQTEATPIADYYIIAGTIYQAPDLATVFNSRIMSTVHHLQTAFEEASGYARYHPSKGYSWDFSSNKSLSDKAKSGYSKKEGTSKDEASSFFQRQRVDMLLGELVRKFPLPNTTAGTGAVNNTPTRNAANGSAATTGTAKEESQGEEKKDATSADAIANEEGTNSTVNVKQEKSDMKPPPEKRMKLEPSYLLHH